MTSTRKRRHLVKIWARAAGRDSAGQPSKASVLFAEVWADVRHPNGLEAIKSDALLSLVKASIRIDYIDGVTAEMWVENEDAIYDIRAVLKDPTGRRHIDLVCELGARRA